MINEKVLYIDEYGFLSSGRGTVAVVPLDFQPDQMLDDINMTLLGYIENNVFEIPYCTDIARKLDIESLNEDLYISNRFNKYELERALIDEVPGFTTSKSFGTDLLKIRYMASQLIDGALILSDGSIKVPLTIIEEINLFEEKMEEAMNENIDIYSLSMDVNLLIGLKESIGHGYIGQIGDKMYLVSNKAIKYSIGSLQELQGQSQSRQDNKLLTQ